MVFHELHYVASKDDGKDTVNGFVDKNEDGKVLSIDHLQKPYSAGLSGSQSNAVSISQHYVKDRAATVFDMRNTSLEHLDEHVKESAYPSTSKDSEPALLLTGQPKTRHKNTVVSYQRTLHGLPVWQEGLSVILDTALQVVNSFSTISTDTKSKPPNNNDKYLVHPIEESTLRELLGLSESDPRPEINFQRLHEYKFNPDDRHQQRKLPEPKPKLPELPKDKITPGVYYVTREVLFCLGNINWRAFIEVETGAVLYLRALISGLHGFVYTADPCTRLGRVSPKADAVREHGDQAREWKELPALIPVTPQQLTGTYVKVASRSSHPPTSESGNFEYTIADPGFSAVNAYYQLASLFRLLERLGFSVERVFCSTKFPLPVEYDGLNDVNARAYANKQGTGAGHFVFGRAADDTEISNACDLRVAAHEFCHALLFEVLHNHGCFSFAHSAGDAIGSILCDPVSKLTNDKRFESFPWTDLNRRHDRLPENGWAWGGEEDDRDYKSEEILNSSLFRAYRSIGGDDQNVSKKQWASRYMLYLIIAAIVSLPSDTHTPIPGPAPFVTLMMDADNDKILGYGYPGGAVHKVIRWSFEKQGLYQPTGVRLPITSKGLPPPVDVYIDDGREGGYEYVENVADYSSNDIWNRRNPDGDTTHEGPIGGSKNYAYVRIKNRGRVSATDLWIYAYHRADNTSSTWPAGFESTTTPPLRGNDIPVRGSIIVGPFEWIPLHSSTEDSLLMAVSARGDLSNIDPAAGKECKKGPIEIEKLVPFDNNIGLRVMQVEQDPNSHGPDS